MLPEKVRLGWQKEKLQDQGVADSKVFERTSSTRNSCGMHRNADIGVFAKPSIFVV
jgi:hypothetical protein